PRARGELTNESRQWRGDKREESEPSHASGPQCEAAGRSGLGPRARGELTNESRRRREATIRRSEPTRSDRDAVASARQNLPARLRRTRQNAFFSCNRSDPTLQ